MRNLFSICALLTILSCVFAAQVFNHDTLNHFNKWIDHGEKLLRQTRDSDNLVKMVNGISQGVKSLPGLSGLTNVNLEELLTTSASLAMEILDSLSCCQGVGVPGGFMRSIESCIREPIINLATNMSGNRQQASMVTPLVYSSHILKAVKGGMCALKCAFDASGVTDANGLPSAPRILKALSETVKQDAQIVFKPAMQACDKELKSALSKKTTPLNEEDKCWAANTYVDCLRVQVFQNCPAARKQEGADCPIKLGKVFWKDLPHKVRTLVDTVKAMFM